METLKRVVEVSSYVVCIVGGALIMAGQHRKFIRKLRRRAR